MSNRYRTIWEKDDCRIIEVPDDCFSIQDLMGDSYDPRHNPDIDPKVLETEKRQFIDLVDNEGVFGYVLEKWNPAVGKGWESIESCWGFVGQYMPNDPTFGHYIVDELKSQVEVTHA